MQPEQDMTELSERAREAAAAAYVPYSGFRVGAALRTADGTIVTGCNVENASFGLTICAERVACTRAVAAGYREFSALAVHVDGEDGAPCGACRQFLSEFGLDLPIAFWSNGQLVQTTLGALLPNAFTPSDLPDQ